MDPITNFPDVSAQIVSVATLNDLELEQPEWDFSNKPAGFTSKFTYGKIPTFEGADGFQLIEGMTIARYREWDTSYRASKV